MQSESERRRILTKLNLEQLKKLPWNWKFWGRPKQHAPAWDWSTWLILAGRGFGKTRTGAEWVRIQAEHATCERMAIIGPTAGDVRDAIVEGESGILARADPDFMPEYFKQGRIVWPNGVQAALYSAEEPDRLRNKQHGKAWGDEVAAWKNPKAVIDQLNFTMRLGRNPQTLYTTTPRPLRFLKDLIADETTALTRGNSYENLTNLSEKYIKQIKQYEGTRLGRQEIWGILLEDVAGALWTHDMLDELRVVNAPELQRVVVALDPSGGAGGDHDEQGIGAAGLGIDDHLYALADRTCSLSPEGWSRRTVETAQEFKADCIVYERNFGGDMVESTLRTAQRKLGDHTRLVGVTASKGKHQRAEPIATRYEQKCAHHVGPLPELEDELVQFTPQGYQGDRSPNRADWLIWAATELLEGTQAAWGFSG